MAEMTTSVQIFSEDVRMDWREVADDLSHNVGSCNVK
jgi:hypothetical protein